MTSLEQRVYVGNLPEDVNNEQLLEHLSSFKISSVDIKQRFTGNTKTTFAFVNVPKKCANKFVRKLNNQEWNGSKLKIEFAKENFLDRLKREREMGNEKKNVHLINNNNIMNALNTSDNEIDAATKSKHFDDELDDVRNDVHELSSANDKVEQQITDNGNQMDKRQLSDMKRCKAIGEKNRLINLKRKQISVSLNQNDQNIKLNKKIRFDDDDDDNDLIEAEKREEKDQEKKKLFDDDDSSDESSNEIDFHLNENDNQHSSQIVKIKANLAGDQRFKLDKRFLDTNEDDNNDHDNVEKKKQLNILEQITGPMKCQNELSPAKVSKVAGFQMKRYDPISGEGEQSNIQPKQNIKKKKERKPTKKKPDLATESEPKAAELPVIVPQTRYYSVNEAVDFSHSSKEKSESFCLKSILERNRTAVQDQCHLERNENATQEDSSTNLKKPKLPPVIKNNDPNSSLVEREILRKFTNTDDTDDTDDESNSDEMGSPGDDRTNLMNQQEPFTTWTEKFFFLDDDERLEDAVKVFEEFKNENTIYLKETLKSLLKSKPKSNGQNKNPGSKREKFIANGKRNNKKGKKAPKMIK